MHRLAALYVGDSLPDAVEMLDQLHTAACEGTLKRTTTLPQDEVVSLLQELIYVAQETLNELGVQQTHQQRFSARHDVVLRLVQKG